MTNILPGDGLGIQSNDSDSFKEPFMVHITNVQIGNSSGIFNGLNVYSWKEQLQDLFTGQPYDLPGGRIGSYIASPETINTPAIEPNNRNIEVGSYVYLRWKGFASGYLLYEIIDHVPDTFAQVTSTTTSGGWYPAILQSWNVTTQSWFEPQRWDVNTQALVSGTCWIRDANNSVLVTGTTYMCTYVGLYQLVPSYATTLGSGNSSGSSGGCNNAAFLLDIDPGSTLTAIVNPGNGRCSCVAAGSFPLISIGSYEWEGGPIQTCCGCGILNFQTTPGSTTAGTLSISFDCNGCSPSGSYSYSMVPNGTCANNCVSFAGAGNLNCNPNISGQYCNNSFTVSVCCGQEYCDICTCCACCSYSASKCFLVTIGGTTPQVWMICNTESDSSSCVWKLADNCASGCGVSITLTSPPNSTCLYQAQEGCPMPVWTLNVNGCLYTCGAGSFSCCQGGTFGSNSCSPSTITLQGISQNLPSQLPMSGQANNGCGNPNLTCTITDVVCASGSCGCLQTSFTMTFENGSYPFTWSGGASTGCAAGCSGIPPCPTNWVAECDGSGSWYIYELFQGTTVIAQGTVISCDPLMVVFANYPVDSGVCCCGFAPCTGTVILTATW